eukprot:CAMPEP_0197064890 /NCGR_PEP_ID=MMETSP1384-20130603/162810_1 /TAXON_ID=29189 /ORGANISM="Ammonia sp." /LENGTH=57 /DNA_ID=CAMNT_0042501565 /DNA_START=51 /DNA_END=221 /DNA_ORIENTATION=+
MNEYLKEMHIKISDRSPLIRTVEKLRNKRQFVDPEEVKLCQSMQLKLKQFENGMNHE